MTDRLYHPLWAGAYPPRSPVPRLHKGEDREDVPGLTLCRPKGRKHGVVARGYRRSDYRPHIIGALRESEGENVKRAA